MVCELFETTLVACYNDRWCNISSIKYEVFQKEIQPPSLETMQERVRRDISMSRFSLAFKRQPRPFRTVVSLNLYKRHHISKIIIYESRDPSWAFVKQKGT